MRTLASRYLQICAFAVLSATLTQSLAQNAPAEHPAAGIPGRATESKILEASELVPRIMALNQLRAEALRGYTGRRIYHLTYHGFPGNRDAELIVEARYTAPATKEFTVISQNGSKLIIDKVLKRLLTSEQDAQNSQNRQQTALTPQNYVFEMAGEEVTDEGHYYILKVEPRIRNKYLYRGTIWVDAHDFAIARIDAEPAVNPSFWISHTRIEQQYARFGSFWLPVRNQSTSKVRLGGTATLVIEYKDYKLSNDGRSDGETISSRVETPY